MAKTPDEIKKGLNVLYPPSSPRTTYSEYVKAIACIPDALAYIEQLEKRNNRLEYTLMGVMHSVDKWLKVEPYDFDKDDGTEAVTRAANAREIALKAIEQIERERDVAVKDMKKMAYESTDGVVCDLCARKDGVCLDCNFEWQGVKEEKDENTRED